MANTARVVLKTVDASAGSGQVFEAHGGNGGRFAMDSVAKPAVPEGMSPVDTLLAALGGCCGMDVIGILRKKRQEITGYEVMVTGERREDHPRRFTRIEVLHRLRGRNLSATAIEEAIRLSDTKYCTVYATLAPAVEMTSRYEILADGT